MTKLNKNLLLLSKIENDQFLAIDVIDVSEVVSSQIELVLDSTEPGSLTIQHVVEPFRIKANRTLIEVLLSNLLNNAIKFSPKGELIKVTLAQGELSVANKGLPLKTDFNKITQRFTKDGAESKGTGLGLAIVKKICDTYGFKFSHRFEAEYHVFHIDFAST